MRSGFGWAEGDNDARGYMPLFSRKTSLALRSYTELKSPKGERTLVYFSLSRGF